MTTKHTNSLPLRVEPQNEYRIAIVTAQGNHYATTYDPEAARLIAAAPELLEFAQMVSRSACLDQRLGNDCICFACEAQRLLAKAEGKQGHSPDGWLVVQA